MLFFFPPNISLDLEKQKRYKLEFSFAIVGSSVTLLTIVIQTSYRL